MVKAKIKINFPCGYEWLVEIKGILVFVERLSDKDLPICPIHGTKCKRC